LSAINTQKNLQETTGYEEHVKTVGTICICPSLQIFKGTGPLLCPMVYDCGCNMAPRLLSSFCRSFVDDDPSVTVNC